LKKSRLGKGLDALIPSEKTWESVTNQLSVDRIKPNKSQPRNNFDEASIMELASSIREKGVIQPLTVRKTGNEYEIIAGERRWRASKLAGIKNVPVFIIEADDNEMLELALIENLQREDLNPIDEAEAYQKLTEEFNLTHEEISKKIGTDRSSISNQLRLLKLTIKAKEALINGLISAGHARALITINDQNLLDEYLNIIIANNLSVRQTEKLVKSRPGLKNRIEKKQADSTDQLYLEAIAEELKKSLGTKVKINGVSGKGRIEIEYYSGAELDRLIGILKSNR
jgi:ParB family chromosome partitioning protein